MEPIETSRLTIDQQRQLHQLCMKYEDAVLSDQPPGPSEWLSNTGDLSVAVVLSEFVAIRSEYKPKRITKSSLQDREGAPAAPADVLKSWREECLQLHPEDADAIHSIFDNAPVAEVEDDVSDSVTLQARLNDKRYQFIEEIDRGGTGAVWLVYDQHLRRETAVKVLLNSHGGEDSERRLRQEARLCGRLSHPGIVPVYELDHFDDGRPFISMKLIRGETLSQRIKTQWRENKRMDAAEFMPTFHHVCEAIGYAHSQHIVHRDLKSANIMVGEFGEVQVMDWGLGKDLDALAGEAAPEAGDNGSQAEDTANGLMSATRPHTVAGAVFGTLAYMPPEQTKGNPSLIDKRSDVFSLGAILCELLTGKPPYVAENTQALLQIASNADLDDAYERLDSCGQPAEFVKLAKHCLRVDPNNRPADASQLATMLEPLLQARSVRKRRLVITGLSITAIVAAGLAVMFAMHSAGDAEAIQARVKEVDRVETLIQNSDRHDAEGETETALDEIRMARRLEDHSQLAVREVNLLRKLGRTTDLANAFAHANMQWPNNSALCSAYVDWLRESGRLADAHQRATRTKIAPGIARELVMQLLLTKQYDDAMEYRDLLESLPDDLELHVQFIPALIKTIRCREALELAEKLLLAHPQNSDVLMACTKSRMEMADYDGAAECLAAWAKLNPVTDTNRTTPEQRLVRQMPMFNTHLEALKSNAFRGRDIYAAVGLKIARHQYQIEDYATSLQYYDQVLVAADNVAFISRRQWVLYAICLPLLANDVEGCNEDTFDQTMALLERQLKDTCIVDRQLKFRLSFLHALVHDPALQRLQSQLRTLNLTSAERETLRAFWKRCRATLAEHTTPELQRQFKYFMKGYTGPNTHPKLPPARPKVRK